MTYKETIMKALGILGGHAYLSDIYTTFLNIYEGDLPKSWKANIRAIIEDNSSDSIRYKGTEDLFYSVDGVGKGHWD